MSFKDNIINAASLLDLDIEEPSYLIEQLVVPGLTILAAAPKEGKSYLIAYLAYCMATGQRPFGTLRAKKAKVLYMALEDNPFRLKKRFSKIAKASLMGGIARPENLDLLTKLDVESPTRFQDLEKSILKESYKVVIIDILQRVIKPDESRGYTKDYSLVKQFKDIADRTNTAIILVHHTNKKTSGNSIDSISGTRGLVGACDNVMVLTRTSKNSDVSKRGTLKLEVKGRDIESNDYHLEYGTKEGFYQLIGDPEITGTKTDKKEQAWELHQKKYTQDQIAELMEISQGYVCKLLKEKRNELLDEGNLDDAMGIDPDDNED